MQTPNRNPINILPSSPTRHVFPGLFQYPLRADNDSVQLIFELHASASPHHFGTFFLRSRSLGQAPNDVMLIMRQGIAALLSSALYIKQKYVS